MLATAITLVSDYLGFIQEEYESVPTFFDRHFDYVEERVS